MMIVLGAAMTWNTTAAGIRNPREDDADQRLAEHRAAVVRAVAAIETALLTESTSD
ncbi:hypothetical protein [Kutzneria sp. NPDC051319]|uniref:hypothetical protein n=1 Tax=Kutzneria sp. NPDC051319 TaxID=3155047 RepID=UPI003419E238